MSRIRILAIIPALNVERQVVDQVIRRIPTDLVDGVLLIDDGSTDATGDVARAAGATVIRHEVNQGVGAAIRTGIEYARRNGFEGVVILNAIGKYDPAGMANLLAPLRAGEADRVRSEERRGGERGRT